MSQIQLATIGDNENLAFYAWRLYHTKLCDVSVINSTLNPNQPITWESSQLGFSNYNTKIYNSLKQFTKMNHSNQKFDIVILSCNSLQDFQSTCSILHQIIHNDTLILIESTGYINLEPFVTSTFSKKSNNNLTNVTVMSIMNESDIKSVSQNKFSHHIRNNDTRIYFGTSSSSSSVTSNKYYQFFYKMLQTIQENSYSSISLLKSSNPKEFMTYQWKLALPRIVFNPLLILFEIEFPQNLENEILTKPLITGLIGELFKLIKKMDCKLVKGFENESNLLKSWSTLYPTTTDNSNYQYSPSLFYKFNKKLDLELDLLLLQPILLGDDHGIRTPYLESLYSILCQFNKINKGSSIFFKRSNEIQEGFDLSDVKEKQQDYDNLISSLRNLEVSKISIDNDISKKEITLANIQQKIIDSESKLNQLDSQFEIKLKSLQNEHEERYKRLSNEYNQKMKDLDIQYQKSKNQHSNSSSPRSIPNQQPTPVQEDQHSKYNHYQKGNGHNKNYRDSVMTQDGLSDLKHIVQYGAILNDEQQTPKLTNGNNENYNENYVDANESSLPPHILQKEMELQRREQALLSREQNRYQQQPHQNYEQQPPQQYYNHQPQQMQYNSGYNPSMNQRQPPPPQNYNYNYNDQVPPHGLPNGGISQNQLSQNLKSQKYPQQYGQQPPMQQRRLSSMVSTNSFSEYQQPQSQHQFQAGYFPPQQQPQMGSRPGVQNHSSFNNAAPIDPFVEQRFKMKKQQPNRKSQMPPMSGNIDGVDFGGRGGMPLPGNRKSISASQQLTSPSQSQRKSNSTIMLNTGAQPQSQQSLPPQQYGNYLQPPQMNESQSSSQSSSATNETPKTSNEMNEHEIRVPTQHQPIYDANAKPLGGISNSNKSGTNDKKKKKGLFNKK